MITAAPAKQHVVSVSISKTSYAEIAELCRQWATERHLGTVEGAHYICVTSVHGVIMAKDDPAIAEIINQADVATADGMQWWLFRLTREPRRLWKRYVLITPRFLPPWAAQKWRRRAS